MSVWPSTNFRRVEFACGCGCGFDTVDAELLTVIEILREHFQTPVRINSGCRCQAHNKRQNGMPGSLHLAGKAADVVVHGVEPKAVADYLESMYPNTYGIGRYARFTHIDVRPAKARWSAA